MKGKARRVDYYPDELIAGVGGVLNASEQGVYWMICSLIMSEGGPIEYNERRLAGLCVSRPGDIRRIVERLVLGGKILRQSDGKLSQKRAQSEVEKSLNRIQTASENGSNGGRPRKKSEQNQQNTETGGLSGEKLTTNHQPPTKKDKNLVSSPRDKRVSDIDWEFENTFWKAYPLKKSKGTALKAYRMARKEASIDEIMEGLRRYAKERQGEDPKYTKHAPRWLNAKAWQDETVATGKGRTATGQLSNKFLFARN